MRGSRRGRMVRISAGMMERTGSRWMTVTGMRFRCLLWLGLRDGLRASLYPLPNEKGSCFARIWPTLAGRTTTRRGWGTRHSGFRCPFEMWLMSGLHGLLLVRRSLRRDDLTLIEMRCAGNDMLLLPLAFLMHPTKVAVHLSAKRCGQTNFPR